MTAVWQLQVSCGRPCFAFTADMSFVGTDFTVYPRSRRYASHSWQQAHVGDLKTSITFACATASGGEAAGYVQAGWAAGAAEQAARISPPRGRSSRRDRMDGRVVGALPAQQ